jgi:hypothetical protein
MDRGTAYENYAGYVKFYDGTIHCLQCHDEHHELCPDCGTEEGSGFNLCDGYACECGGPGVTIDIPTPTFHRTGCTDDRCGGCLPSSMSKVSIDWMDVPQEQLGAAAAIVLALAGTSEPLIDNPYGSGAWCSLCNADIPQGAHKDTCPWRQAREWAARNAMGGRDASSRS